MNILIIGSGGREHALAWKAGQSAKVDTVFVAPGNAGTAAEPNMINLPIDVLDFDGLVNAARENNIDLTIVGPEVPLVAGIVDHFRTAGLKCFGPTRAAAQLEGSKAFTKDFLARHHIPTAFYSVFTEIPAAIDFIRAKGAPIVVKADGLAAGKGVILAQTEAEAIAAVEDMLAGNKFGDAGARVVIEQFLTGEEASFIVMVDGENTLPMASSQDHKARDNEDKGPNTGGMGAYSPAPVVTPEIHERIMQEVIVPTVKGMKAEGNEFSGFLYAGIMVAEDGTPNVLEFNVRLGDPETQPIMMRLKSDLVELCEACLERKLDKTQADWDDRAALGVVLAAGGYPDSYEKGLGITGIPSATPISKVFHAGTSLNEQNQLVTNGGRVLCAVGLGESVAEAQKVAYESVHSIQWKDVFYRTDIGYRAIQRNS
ncbi:phosphoribosylamine--glycine ligase [Gynuella sunshinyii]|uniref:Phosphoribosylamine--glycine ligase n=1 Tax=Gynuella sunshinyii YC6258 TaxID=1445510 RepID=A0A0C5V4J0_9GAMM|nr:phosphoribosylamine--glycine ligase [Gynuella sunshinyii]AJQ94400.1 phosphoribosylamine-glycine ligase [Gynuella sunshinyii YC6258]